MNENEELEPLVNQTGFADSSTFVQPDTSQAPKKIIPEDQLPEVVQVTKKLNRRLVDSIVIVGIIIVVLGLSAVFSAMQRTILRNDEVEPSPTPVVLESDPATQKLRALQQELKSADPATDSLPFPPLDMTIAIDPPPKR